jgi:flagellar assembly protein FliH
LTKELLNDIKEATQIEIKVNPLDYDYVKDNLNLEKVKITPDNAISIGGVVILSDAGNIEAEIHKRFENIKKHILKG